MPTAVEEYADRPEPADLRTDSAPTAQELIAFMDDDRYRVVVDVERDLDFKPTHYTCTYRDPVTGRRGREYGETASDALRAALRVLRWCARHRTAVTA